MCEFWRIVNLISIYNAQGSVYRNREFHIYLIHVAVVYFPCLKSWYTVFLVIRVSLFFFWTSLWYKHFTSKLIYRTRKYWHPLSSFISNIPLFFLSSMNVVHWCTWEIDSTNISVCIGNYLQVIGKIKKS